ncbi:MAG: hypothetical protein ACOC9O_02835 [Myxococcota bacterium]
MTSSMTFEYAQARLQSRHGARLDRATWIRLFTSRDLSHFLESARRTALQPYLQHLDARADSHGIERGLRREVREHIEEVAGWVPSRWRPSVRFTRWLVDLPAVARLLEDGPPPTWTLEDPVLAPFAADDLDARRGALLASELAFLVPSGPGGGEPGDREPRAVFLETWRGLLPALPSGGRAEALALAGEVEAHLEEMEAVEDRVDGWNLRVKLEVDLARRVRRQSARPVAVFAHLLLFALEIERLRGALVRRALFPHVPADPSWA